MNEDIIVHGVEWTVKELFVYPNEFIYWSIQIVMYPYMTGLVAGAFVLSSLYHVFGQKELKEIAQFSLVFSLALLPVAALPLLLHSILATSAPIFSGIRPLVLHPVKGKGGSLSVDIESSLCALEG